MAGSRRSGPWHRHATPVAVATLVMAATLTACTASDAGYGADPATGTGSGPATATATGAGPGADPTTARDQTVTTTVTTVVTRTGTRSDDVSGDGDGTDAPFPADTGTDTGGASGLPVLFTDLRVGSHDGVDRVVWEFAGGGSPGWRVEYVTDPMRDPSGLPVELAGDATLQVVITNLGNPGDVDAPGARFYDGPEVVQADSTDLVTEVLVGDVFEGQLTGFVGVVRESPFRVYALDDPARVVLEVRRA